MRKLDWNFERYRTRDRLLECDDFILPILISNKEIPQIYPWRDRDLSTLQKEIIEIARQKGYTDSEDNFWSNFNKEIIYGTLSTFPEIGEEHVLYFDTETSILYYYNETYLPIRTLLIDDTILNSGDAAEFID